MTPNPYRLSPPWPDGCLEVMTRLPAWCTLGFFWPSPPFFKFETEGSFIPHITGNSKAADQILISYYRSHSPSPHPSSVSPFCLLLFPSCVLCTWLPWLPLLFSCAHYSWNAACFTNLSGGWLVGPSTMLTDFSSSSFLTQLPGHKRASC